ncbi:MAG: MFS transporter [Acidobacteria bacterium]|nr:MFS transporter [Acidobacteriota bacterium]
MSLAERLRELRSGFAPTFWVANTLELFERLAFYGSKAILAVYVAEKVGLGAQLAATLVGAFSGVLYSLPIVAGTFVDRYGFRRTLAACFAFFTVGYFLIGLAGLSMGQPLVDMFGKGPYITGVLFLTAVGGSLIKPCIVGTVANTSTEKTRSLGYSIYYTLVNFGGALGPILALQVREGLGIEYVLVMSSITSLAMLIGTLLFFKEPVARETGGRTLPQVLKDMVLVFGNLKFMLFLVIFSGFYAMFWQIFYSLPFYAKQALKFEQFELLETVDALTIIFLTVPMTALAKSLRPITAMATGFGIASVVWLLIPMAPSVGAVVAAVGLFAAGEGLLAPRFYEYVAGLAPKDQVGTYMGFAFLPVAIGSFTAGPLAGWLVSTFIEGGGNPHHMWYVVSGVGLASTAGMVVYNAVFAGKSAEVTP